MNRYKPFVYLILAGTLTLLCLVKGVRCKSQILEHEGQIYLVNQNTASDISVKDAVRMQEEKQEAGQVFEFTNWSIVGETILYNAELDKNAEAEIIAAKGDIRGLIPASTQAVLEKGTCVIDRQTSFSLFGTVGSIGNKISYNEQEYEVSQVIKAPAALFIYDVGEEAEISLNRVTILAKEAEVRSTIQEFSGQYQDWKLIDRGIYCDAANFVFLFIPCFLIFILLRLICRYYKESSEQWKLQLIWAAAGFFVSIVFIWFFSRVINITPDMIPGKWSDFSFWGTWFSGKMEGVKRVVTTEKNVFEIAELIRFLQTVLWGLLSGVGAIITYRCYQTFQKVEWKDWLSRNKEAQS